MILTDMVSYINGWITLWTPIIVGVFLTISPLTSYGDTLLTIIRTKTSQGFSIDLCAIMLISSIMRVFFWLGRPFEVSLLLQALVMIGTQCGLLYVALKYRDDSISWLPGPNGGSSLEDIEMKHLGSNRSVDDNRVRVGSGNSKNTTQHLSHMVSHRPFNFWQWKITGRYWHFLLRFTVVLSVLQFLFGSNESYIAIIGFLGLFVESTLPIPQILTIRRNKSVDGFRVSLLASWLGGDISKLTYFVKGGGNIAPQFVICGLIQTSFDIIVAVYYVYYRFLKNESTVAIPLKGNVNQGQPGIFKESPVMPVQTDRRRRLSVKQVMRND